MKKTYFFAFMAIGFAALAQSPKARVEAQRTADNNEQRPARSASIMSTYTGTETVVWSEDFANGIPATWDNTGGLANNLPDPDSKWEYRGASTTPGVNIGSRGAYAAGTVAIQSPTAANGFVIFDSDFLDNGGIAGGTGVAAAPHVASLTTGVINLTGLSNLDLKFNQCLRKYFGSAGNGTSSATYVEFSIDGGVTFPVSITLNPSLVGNGYTGPTSQVVVPIPNSVAGQANVKMRIKWNGDYYFWMIDDLQITSTPKHRLEFVKNSDGAPQVDILYGPASGSSKLGTMSLKQVRPITFDANVKNTGQNVQQNVKLQIKVLNTSGSVINTINGPVKSVLNVNDTADYNDLNTYSSAWVPSAAGTYGIAISVLSDSTVVNFPDTMVVSVTNDINSLDFSRFSNSIGTPNIGDNSALAARHDFLNPERLFGVNVGLSFLTTSGGIVEMSVFDSSAFISVTAGFDQNAILAYSQLTLTSADTAAGQVYFDLTDPTTGFPMYLPQGSYFFVFSMTKGSTNGVIRVKNDQSFENASGSALMYYTTTSQGTFNTWYNGFNDRSFENPWIRSKTCESANPVACMGIGLTEEAMASITVAPVPANEFMNVAFGDADGQFELTLIDITGKVVKARNVVAEAGTSVPVYVGDLAAGMYTLSVQNGAQVKTLKVAIQ
jgi:hypothetical protein